MDLEMFKRMGETFTIGSHMYGLNTPESDHDELTVYFDKEDYLNLVRKLPDVKEMHGNNTKLYALDYFAGLVVKGNPNLVETVHLTPTRTESSEVGAFMRLMAQSPVFLVHQGVARAYMGHLNGILKELQNKGVTPKRLSHAMRIVYSLEHILNTGELYSLVKDPQRLEVCLSVKTNPVTSETEKMVRESVKNVEEFYRTTIDNLPDNKGVVELVNQFFRGIYL